MVTHGNLTPASYVRIIYPPPLLIYPIVEGVFILWGIMVADCGKAEMEAATRGPKSLMLHHLILKRKMSSKIIEEDINKNNWEVLKNYGVSVDFAISNLNPSFVRLSSEAAICKTKEIAEIMNKKYGE